MAFTLASHILPAVPFGVALPAITLLMHYRGLRKGDAIALLLARRWSAVMAVQFAIGIVTGTVLSFSVCCGGCSQRTQLPPPIMRAP